MCIYTPQREAVDAGYVIKTGSPGLTRGEFTRVFISSTSRLERHESTITYDIRHS